MQFLTQELAQEIVERTMKILNKNINVMDENGIIIGSGERERLNQIHDGALLVLRNAESVEIDDKKASKLKGSKPGINLPIRFNNQIVGVVGITGKPDQIRNYAELVKMAAELVLEQSFLLERVQWKQRLQSEIVNQLISGGQVNDAWVKERSGFMGVDLEQRRTAIVFQPSDYAESENQKLINAIHYELGKQDLIGTTFNHEIVILKTGSQSEQSAFIKRLFSLANGKGIIASGCSADNIKEVRVSFQNALRLLQLGPILKPEADFYCYEDFRLEVILSQLAQTEQTAKALPFYERLLEQDKKGELAHTLAMYIKESGELNKIADQLFIHRNTLRYRLDKITELTGRDPRNIRDLMELYIAKLARDLQ